MKSALVVVLLSLSLASVLIYAEPQDGPEQHPPIMCHYDPAEKTHDGCACAGQKHEQCGVDPATGHLLRDNRMCKAYCDMSMCHCCIS